MKEFIIKGLVFLALAFAPLYPLAHYYDSRLPKHIKEKGIWILSLRDLDLDYAVIGSSRVYNVVAPHVIDSLDGTTGINFGIGGVHYAENALTFSKFLEHGNKVKWLFIQVDLWGLIAADKAYSHPFNDQDYLNLIGDPQVDSIIHANTDPLKYCFRKYVPFFKYAEYNNIYPLNEVYNGFRADKTEFSDPQGSNLLGDKDKQTALIASKGSQMREVDPNSVASLLELIRIARKNDVQVAFFSSPISAEYVAQEKDYPALQDTLRKIATENKIHYYEFQTLSICNEKDYFRDATHMNRKGGLIFSAILADSIQDCLKNIH